MTGPVELSNRQTAIVDTIRKFRDAYGYSPTYRQIAASVGLASASTVAYQLGLLAEAGVVRFDPTTPRSVVPINVGADCTHCGGTAPVMTANELSGRSVLEAGFATCGEVPDAAPGIPREWTLTITAPAPWLNANGRVDRRSQTPDRRAWRDAGRIHGRQARIPQLAKAHIIATLRFPTNHRRDPHNYFLTAKACVDGLVDAGLLVDDSYHYLIGPDMRMGEQLVKKPGGPVGELILTIREVIG